jgi:hypothetical protein
LVPLARHGCPVIPCHIDALASSLRLTAALLLPSARLLGGGEAVVVAGGVRVLTREEESEGVE